MDARPVAPRRQDVDVDELRERLSRLARKNLGAQVSGLAALDGGRSSLTYRADLDFVDRAAREPVVVRLAPPGLTPVGNRDVLRQARLMVALAADGHVPVPGVRLQDAGEPPDVPPLFVMDLLPGEASEPIFAASGPLANPEIVRARALVAVESLARLHHVPTGRVSTGETIVTLEDELARWTNTLGAAGAAEAAEPIRARLAETMPDEIPPTIVHGDFRLGNLLFVGADLQAVLDWEIWTLGDPRIDLAWLLLTAMPDEHPAADRKPTGMPTADELAARYYEHSERPGALAEVPWFIALALYKMAAMARHIGKKFSADDSRRTGREAAAKRMLAESLTLL